jgi:tRNA nucleotidyltransferase/poly(A) polymerase
VTRPTDPELARKFAEQVVQQLRNAGHEALWAGGCVRDQCLGKPPKDFDVATDARPDQIRKIFGYRRTLAIGAAFGVVTVLGPPAAGQIEVATFRREEGYSDGRHPDKVDYSTAEEDAQRRDFTINGLFFDPIAGETIDYVGGMHDLAAHQIRCIGNPHERIDEDKLRMLRAVRFATTLEFEVDAETRRAIAQHADEIACVSAERIAAEMRRILTHPNRWVGLRWLRASGLWRVILPEYADLQEPQLGHAWCQLESILGQLVTDDFATILAAIVWPIGQGDRRTAVQTAEKLCDRWKLSNQDLKRTVGLLKHESTLRQAKQVEWPELQRVLIDPSIDALIHLARAIAVSVDGNDEQVAYSEAQLKLPIEQLNPTPLVNGHDLSEAGVPRGPKLGELLTLVRNAQLDGQIQTREEAIALAMEKLSNGQ